MKNLTLLIICLFTATLLSGCGLMEDAFKAGVIITLIIIAIIGVVIWLLRLTWKLLTKFFPGILVWYNNRAGFEE